MPDGTQACGAAGNIGRPRGNGGQRRQVVGVQWIVCCYAVKVVEPETVAVAIEGRVPFEELFFS